MALRTAGSVLVLLLLSVAATTATQRGQKIQVMVSPTNAVWGQNVTVTCNTTCTLTDNHTYIWYMNGQRLSSSSKSTLSSTSYHSTSYSCAVKGFEDLLSPAMCLQVKVTPATEKGNLTLTCSTTFTLTENPKPTYIWYKNGQHLTNSKTLDNSLILNPVSSEDAGRYTCAVKGHNNLYIPEETLTVISAYHPASHCWQGTRDTVDNRQGNSSPMNDNISGMAMTPTSVQRADTDNQDDVHYTSIHFSGSNNQEVPLYSTVQLPQTQKEDEDVQYAVVKFNRSSAAPPTSLTGS
ncbi:carcinoembryonic antigen-related cell adhesion molecule 1-like [Oncorhynchus mykiss]|uniref:carcinoembryonic antigen-related cell adhesion molecule 1-like n=1 Tax=Oncorhynchus mykiss TaxID=8022 RepID=UPI001878E92F|nr:carcinoembryonic antigen-related cell adhesion molecule 1-like [Oncorhynchus mykiss]